MLKRVFLKKSDFFKTSLLIHHSCDLDLILTFWRKKSLKEFGVFEFRISRLHVTCLEVLVWLLAWPVCKFTCHEHNTAYRGEQEVRTVLFIMAEAVIVAAARTPIGMSTYFQFWSKKIDKWKKQTDWYLLISSSQKIMLNCYFKAKPYIRNAVWQRK